MVADELALSLADRYVRPGYSVLDPFCGSGRLLVAAARVPGLRVGLDVNPLACLLTRAKLARPDPLILASIIDAITRDRRNITVAPVRLRGMRKVKWFSPFALKELTQIVNWLNKLALSKPERLIVAAVLSGVARDASYARKDCWKLHRLSADNRQTFNASPWDCFKRRLSYCVSEISHQTLKCTDSVVEMKDARNLARSPVKAAAFDVILTSPPYGDSRTTVQYGAASSLCLDFVSRIDGLEDMFATGGNIDAHCLGGSRHYRASLQPDELRPYWAGRSDTSRARAVAAFLGDYEHICSGIARCLKPGGTAVLVVGQRSTGGFRLKLDQFTVDCLEGLGLRSISVEHRPLREKHLPHSVNRFARCASAHIRAKGFTRTMSNELVLTFRKTKTG